MTCGLTDGFVSAFVGGFISAMYYMDYSEDSLTLKVLVAAVWVLDTIQVSFMIHALYYYLPLTAI
ncbi:hypothetical protein EDD15DRAFT_2208027 [Pisolithus albus]|nr:hypothetical protein EDD15DRAFT_2208027 [Pisolithus albus]